MTRAQAHRSPLRRALGAVLIAAFALSTSSSSFAEGAQLHRLLFIGDSFTGVLGGVYTHVARLAQAANPTQRTVVDSVWRGGQTLKMLWEGKDAEEAIDTDKYDVVVLQDDIPEVNVDYFRFYARAFVDETRKHHARPVLYMTWSYDRLGWISMQQIIDAHLAIAKQLNVDVAPVGLAWRIAQRRRPDLDMYGPDREHPSTHGMYLAACVIYASIYQKSPVAVPYVMPGITPSDARTLQEIAVEAMHDWKKLRRK